MKQTPKAFLLHGFVGAGKTTFAKRLETAEMALRFTHDEWMNQLYGEDPPAEHFADYARRVFTVMETTWTRCLDVGTSVILDFGFWTRADRERTRAVVAEHGGEAVLYRPNCTDDLPRGRDSTRTSSLAGSLFTAPNPFRGLKSRFEPLEDDEERIEIAPFDTR